MNSRDYEIFKKFNDEKKSVEELSEEYDLTQPEIRKILTKGYKSF